MKRHSLTLTDPVNEMVAAQVKSGRYKDFSAAIQDAVWNYFIGAPSPFVEYDVSPAEVERVARRELANIDKDRRAGKLKAWKPAA